MGDLSSPIMTSSGEFSIQENNTAVTILTAADADFPAPTLTYSIPGGNDAAFFTVNAYTGELTFLSVPNFELPKDSGADNIYNLTVQISDGILNSVLNFAVMGTPVNESPPVLTSPDIFSIPENRNAVTILAASDADSPSQPLTYSVISGLDAIFFHR